MSIAVIAVGVVLTSFVLIRLYIQRKWKYCKLNKDLKNKIFLITGCTSGLGWATTKEIVKRYGKVYMACRNINKAKHSIEEFAQNNLHCKDKMLPVYLDLADLESVCSLAKYMQENHIKIHVLILNAGIYLPANENLKTKDGFEVHMGVNYLGHFLLVNLLLENLKSYPPSKIIIITSSLYKYAELHIDDLSTKNQITHIMQKSHFNVEYNNSKLACLLLSVQLALKVKESGINVFSVCPGLVCTNMIYNAAKNIKFWKKILLFLPLLLLMRTPYQGIQTILYCIMEENLISGACYQDCNVLPFDESKYDYDFREKLWEKSLDLVFTKKLHGKW